MGYHGYILVYSITSTKSFDLVKDLYEKIIDTCGTQKIPCVIVGSKCDEATPSSQQLSKDGENFAKNICAAWVETSAQNNINVGAYMFLDVIRDSQLSPFIDKVFQLCLAEIQKSTPGTAEPAAERGKCRIM